MISVLRCGAAQLLAVSARTDHVTGVLLPQTSSVAELHLGARVQAVAAQSEQLLQAANELLAMMLQVHAAVLLVATATHAIHRLVQLPLNSQNRRPANVVAPLDSPKVPTHLPLGHLRDGGGGQVTCAHLPTSHIYTSISPSNPILWDAVINRPSPQLVSTVTEFSPGGRSPASAHRAVSLGSSGKLE